MNKWQQLRETWRNFNSHLKTLVVSFIVAFATQLLEAGMNSLDNARTYVVAVGASVATLIVRYLNPYDKSMGVKKKDSDGAE